MNILSTKIFKEVEGPGSEVLGIGWSPGPESLKSYDLRDVLLMRNVFILEVLVEHEQCGGKNCGR